jgi:hypothetical protein
VQDQIDRLYERAFACGRSANQQRTPVLRDLWDGIAQSHLENALRIIVHEMRKTPGRPAAVQELSDKWALPSAGLK